MIRMSVGSYIQEVISKCSKCLVVDKPPCVFKIYERYLPKELITLVVSESPPPGRKQDYIYNLESRDRLRRVLGEVLGIDEGEVINYLMNHGIFWSTAVKCRPISKSYLRGMRRNCVYVLTEEIKRLRPKRIVALGRYAWESVDEALTKLNLRINVVKHYHPLYLRRFMKWKLLKLRSILLSSNS